MHNRSLSLLAAVISTFTLLPAYADDPAPGADSSERLDTVLVTGTRGKARTVLDSPVPVDVLTAADLKSAGANGGELGQALQTLLPSFNFPRQSNSGGADHVRAAQLRGMSPDQVLVLVNGKRRHTSAVVNDSSKIGRGTAPVDFNSIPISAVCDALVDGVFTGVIRAIRGGHFAAFRGVIENDIDHPGNRVGTVLGARAVAQHFNAFDGADRDRVEVHRRRATADFRRVVDHRRGVPTFAVDQHQHLIRAVDRV